MRILLFLGAVVVLSGPRSAAALTLGGVPGGKPLSPYLRERTARQETPYAVLVDLAGRGRAVFEVAAPPDPAAPDKWLAWRFVVGLGEPVGHQMLVSVGGKDVLVDFSTNYVLVKLIPPRRVMDGGAVFPASALLAPMDGKGPR